MIKRINCVNYGIKVFKKVHKYGKKESYAKLINEVFNIIYTLMNYYRLYINKSYM